VAVEGIVYAFGQMNRPAAAAASAPQGQPGAPMRKTLQGVLTAIRAASGEIVWQKSYPAPMNVDHPGMRATPTIEGDRIYTFGVGGDLVAWNRSDGAIIWRCNVLQETHSQPIRWGCASSAVIDGQRIYVQCGTGGPTAVAVDKDTGKILWKSQAQSDAGYSTIEPVASEKEKMLLVLGGDHFIGMDTDGGKTLWSIPFETEYKINACTPLVHEDRVLLINEYKQGKTLMLQLRGRQEPQKVWEDTELRSRTGTPILEGDNFYINNRGTIECRRWADGNAVWRCQDKALDLGPVGGPLVRAGELMIAYSEHGRVSLTKMTPAGCELRGQVTLFDEGETWATPLIYGGRLYVRGNNDLVCLDIAAK
jgi:hypothetical protein